MKPLKPFWIPEKKPFEGYEDKNNNFYSSTLWRKLRESVIHRDKNICQMCEQPIERSGKPAQVDHIKPINKGGQTIDPANLQTLCYKCHAAKTSKDK